MGSNADDKGLRPYYLQGSYERWDARASMYWQIKFQVTKKKKKDLESENGTVHLKHTVMGGRYYKLILQKVIKTDSWQLNS